MNFFYKYKNQIIITSTVLVLTIFLTLAFVILKKNNYIPKDTLLNTATSSKADSQEPKVQSISLSEANISLQIGQSEKPIVTMTPSNISDKSEKWESSNESIAKVDKGGNITGVSKGKCTVTVSSVNNPSVKAEIAVEVREKADLTYINGILIVNKSYPLPKEYNPGVNQEASDAFTKMQTAASNDGINIYISSGFRSYDLQSYYYNNCVNVYGVEETDKFSARPGFSEHQSGLCFDLNSIDDSFADTNEGKWVAENCHKYGFIIRYPKGKEEKTGYKYEPWHIRYLGVDNATSVYNSGLCLEEYLGITSYYK